MWPNFGVRTGAALGVTGPQTPPRFNNHGRAGRMHAPAAPVLLHLAFPPPHKQQRTTVWYNPLAFVHALSTTSTSTFAARSTPALVFPAQSDGGTALTCFLFS